MTNNNSVALIFSLDEKEKFKAMDFDGACHEKVLRILKVIRNLEATLQLLTSFLLKTALFTEIDKRSIQNDWKFYRLRERLWDVMGKLESDLRHKWMPHYFIAGVDLLYGIPLASISKMRDRLSRIRGCESVV